MINTQLAAVVGHVADESIPWIDAGDHRYKLLRVERASGLRVVRLQLPPGFRAPRHRHTGDTIGYTLSGAWGYEEYGSRYEANSLIYEQMGSVHTLIVFPDNKEVTDAVFIGRGGNLTLDEDDNVIAVSDSETLLEEYYQRCDAAGVPRPTHIEA
jgi:quercetin dioxygenase-like cupin family protein